MSKKQVSSMMSGMGVGVSILQGLVDQAQSLGLTDDEIHRLATPEGAPILAKLAETLAVNTPPSIRKNEHGHYIVTFTGRNFTGPEWISRILPTLLTPRTRYILESKNFPVQPFEKKRYSVVIVPGDVVARELKMPVNGDNFEKLRLSLVDISERLGYGAVTANAILLLRDALDYDHVVIKDADVRYLIGLHTPLHYQNRMFLLVLGLGDKGGYTNKTSIQAITDMETFSSSLLPDYGFVFSQ